MGCLTNYMEDEIIDHILGEGGETWSRPANLWLALCTADPGEGATGANITEPASNYARKACDSWNAASSRAIDNSAVITYDEATGSWGTVTHWAIVDSASGAGNVLAYGSLTVSKLIVSGDTPEVAVQDLDISVDAGDMSNYLANKILDHIFKGDAYTQPVVIFAGLTTDNIVDSDTGSTVSEPGSNYARKGYDDWDASSAGATANGATISFVKSTGDWGTLTDGALFDTLSGGNLLFYHTLGVEKSITNGDTAKFPTGDFDVTID